MTTVAPWTWNKHVLEMKRTSYNVFFEVQRCESFNLKVIISYSSFNSF